MVVFSEDNYIAHYGVLRKSGRYPWGSGGDPYQDATGFLGHVEELRKQGLSETDIASGLGITTSQLRAQKSIARNEKKQADIGQAQKLKDKGYSNVAIGKRMGINESSVRALLAPAVKDRTDILNATTGMLKEQVEKKNYIDVGKDVNTQLNISNDKLKVAIAALQEQGYKVHYLKVQQLGTGKNTTIKVLTKDTVTYSELLKNQDKVRQITEFSDDGGRSYLGLQTPININKNRVTVRYAKDGGAENDGLIFVRPGVTDLSLGASRYAQVRIAVAGSHYLKGMAMYKDDLPDGVDIMFNTNKSDTGNSLDAMKPISEDPDNPFGSTIRRQLIDPATNKVTSAMNIVYEEGDWDRWSRTISSQTLSKQNPTLAKTQLGMTYDRKKSEFDEIKSLTNPAVRKKLLESFSDDVDSSAVHLKAAALPRSSWHVLLPFNSLKENEIYAPNYNDGDRVALIRYPHAGTFEIPELIVNNKSRAINSAIGRAKDAVGINAKVAERLSGADFDGDSVLVIPNNNNQIKTSPALEGLKGFDPRHSYPAYDGMPKMKDSTKQREMGNVTNLIADMTIRGANPTELARAVRHSMVVIDAEKHNLNYKQSARDNGIAQLKTKYQGDARAGASTLITRATSEFRGPDRKPRSAAKGGPIDKATGRRVFEETGESYVDADGKLIRKTFKSKKLAETDDAFTLSSGTTIEKVYAEHSNRLKDLANRARKEAVNTKTTPYSPSAKKAYAKEVETLDAKLRIALSNSPRERQAQLLANAVVSAKRRANPDMKSSDLKKIKAQALAESRARANAKKERINIEIREWEAIQAGAVSNNKLNEILRHTDLDRVKELATPRTRVSMSASKIARASAMANSGYTQAEIASALGVSLSTLKSALSKN